MFFKYLEPLFEPFRKAKSKALDVKHVKGRVKMDANRVKNVGAYAKSHVKDVGGQVQAVGGKAKAVGGKAKAIGGKIPGRGAGVGGAPSANLNPNPGVKKVGWFRRKRVCVQCNQKLDKTWDSCPYCAQAAAAPGEPPKTQAFMLDAAGSGAPMQLLGWVVPVQGPQRGELYTLAPVSSVGTDPGCHIVLSDQYMSSVHAEIKAEGGVWMVRDLGSTNGTYVNDKRVDQQELIDNDFVKFGQSLVKFKSL